MDHFISLTIPTEHSDEVIRPWFRAVKETVASGLMTTMQTGDRQIAMSRKSRDGKTVLAVPLTRDLTEPETKRVIAALDAIYEGDYSLTSSSPQEGVPEEIEIEVDHGPLIELSTAWAKQQHDEWMKDKLAAGWRYGTKVSLADKTHPLLRQWIELPADYRVVDTARPEALLKLFNDHGYVLIPKTDLDQLR